MITYDIEINGLMVHAHYSRESVEGIFIPLLKKLTDMQKSSGKRILVMLAAPPGAGKSTLSEFLKYLSERTEGVVPITVIGMDGFHRYQDYLTTHTTMRDGEEILMVKIKGAPVTFDLPKLKAQIQKVTSGENCGWPLYNRVLHNPVENAITVNGDIILLEGNYLLLEDAGWNELKDFADYTIRIIADENDLRKRLVERKMMSGTEREAAEQFVEFSDLRNARLCLEHSMDADLVLEMDQDGIYRKK